MYNDDMTTTVIVLIALGVLPITIVSIVAGCMLAKAVAEATADSIRSKKRNRRNRRHDEINRQINDDLYGNRTRNNRIDVAQALIDQRQERERATREMRDQIFNIEQEKQPEVQPAVVEEPKKEPKKKKLTAEEKQEISRFGQLLKAAHPFRKID